MISMRAELVEAHARVVRRAQDTFRMISLSAELVEARPERSGIG